jgi:predicted transcriptional regulator
MKIVGQALANFRKKANMEISDVIPIMSSKYRIEISQMTLRRVEQGERVVPLDELIILSKIYKFDILEVIKIAQLEIFDNL